MIALSYVPYVQFIILLRHWLPFSYFLFFISYIMYVSLPTMILSTAIKIFNREQRYWTSTYVCSTFWLYLSKFTKFFNGTIISIISSILSLFIILICTFCTVRTYVRIYIYIYMAVGKKDKAIFHFLFSFYYF